MFLHLDGRYRKTNECNFLEQVDEELTKFVKNSKHNRVLVFPPLASQYRFLIHQLVGNYPALQTVSIGQGKERRTVVYQVNHPRWTLQLHLCKGNFLEEVEQGKQSDQIRLCMFLEQCGRQKKDSKREAQGVNV